jgi:hypothetical protein
MPTRQNYERSAQSSQDCALKLSAETVSVSPELIEELRRLRKSLAACRKRVERIVDNFAA